MNHDAFFARLNTMPPLLAAVTMRRALERNISITRDKEFVRWGVRNLKLMNNSPLLRRAVAVGPRQRKTKRREAFFSYAAIDPTHRRAKADGEAMASNRYSRGYRFRSRTRLPARARMLARKRQ